MTEQPATSLSASSVEYTEERRLNSPQEVNALRSARERKGLKTDVKLCTAFVKKVSIITEETAPGLIRDISTGDKLNLVRFVEEISSSLSKASIKMKDIPNVTLLCSAMHRLYAMFLDPLLQSLVEQYESCLKSDQKVDITRRKILLRWGGELYVSGLLPDMVFVKMLRQAIRLGMGVGPLEEENALVPPISDQALANLGAISSLMKQLGSELLFDPPIATRILLLCKNYVRMCLQRLMLEATQLRRMRLKLDVDLLRRGLSPTAEQTEALDRRERNVEEVFHFCEMACDFLHMDKPEMPRLELEEEKAIREEKGLELFHRRKGEQELSLDAWIFTDDTNRAFYQDLDELHLVIPPMILNRADQALQPEPGLITPTTITELPKSSSLAAEDVLMNATPDFEDEEDDGKSSSGNESVPRPVEELMLRLPNLLSVRLVDSFARDFVHLNSKSARKRLVQELFQVPWGRMELLPFYARLACTISNLVTGVGNVLSDSVRSAYFKSVRDKRPGSRMSSRLRNAKYLGELVKFGIRYPNLGMPPGAAFIALKQTLESFQGENIDMACMLLETCGRELYRLPRTHPELLRLLEMVQRHRTAKNLSPSQDAAIENAFYHCIPPEHNRQRQFQRRQRSEVELYVRYLLLNKLGAYEVDTTEDRSKMLQRQTREVLEALLTLPWKEQTEEVSLAISRAFLASCKSRSGSLSLVCLVLAQLSRTYFVCIQRTCEDMLSAIYYGLESSDARLNQRRIGQAKCLGHMLRQNLISDDLFFDTLFALLHWNHGVSTPLAWPCTMALASRFHPSVPCPSDPPFDAFRVRLVCASLEVAADRVVLPASFPKLNLFLRYLERYVWNKAYFPLEVEFVMIDSLQELERHYLAWKQKKLKHVLVLPSQPSHKIKKQMDAFAKTHGIKLVGRASSKQQAEDFIAQAEGKGFASSLVSASLSSVREEEDEEEEEEEEEEEVGGSDDEEDDNTQHDNSRFFEERQLTAEDLAFDAEFAKLMKDTIDQSGKANLSGTAAARGDNLVIPLNIIKKSTQSQSTPPVNSAPLQLLKRTANRKVEVRTLFVPADTLLAKASSSSRDLQEKQEQAAMKRLTLATTTRMREGGELV